MTSARKAKLAKLERPRLSAARRGGVLLLPPIQSIDDWERDAAASQAALATATREGVVDDRPAAAAGPALDAPWWWKGQQQ